MDLRDSAKRNSHVPPPSFKAPKASGKKRTRKPKAKSTPAEALDLEPATSTSSEPVAKSPHDISELMKQKSQSMPPMLETIVEPTRIGKECDWQSAGTQPKPATYWGCDCFKYAWTRMIDVVDDHRTALEDAKPEVAMIVPVDDTLNASCTSDLAEEAPCSLSPSLKVRASGSLRFYGTPGKLLVVQLQDDHPKSRTIPAVQLEAISLAIDRWDCKTLEGTVPWALHDPSVTAAILSREAAVLAVESESWRCSTVNRILHTLRICVPAENGAVMKAYRNHYGEAFAFQAVWAYFLIQALWFQVPFIIGAIVFDFGPAVNGVERVKFEFLKAGVIVWGFLVAVVSSSKYQGEKAVAELKRSKTGAKRRSTVNQSFDSEQKKGVSCKRWGTLLGVAIPVLFLFIVFCMFTLLMVTNLILHVIYVWGDCYNLHRADDPCRDAEKKHGIFGWAAEVGCDIALAILFELFFAISSALADWISNLLNFEYASDKKYFINMLEVFLAALERIGFVGSLAFAFVPQWEPPHGGKDTIDMSIDCSDLMMGESSYFCLQRRLPVSLRRWLLEKLMKGPFTVAPFVSIMIKTFVPLVVFRLHQVLDYCIKYGVFCSPMYPLRFVVRFFTLIFALDGDNVGCCKFPALGWPFSDVSPDAVPHGSMILVTESKTRNAEDLAYDPATRKRRDFGNRDSADLVVNLETTFLNNVLEQGVRKPFEPEDELMELQMGFLWIVFFTPLRPFGVITTLAARVLEIHSDMLKMTHVRRRSFPAGDKEMRREQTSFVNAVMIGSLGWTMGLSLITYNDDLYLWGVGGKLIYGVVMLWLFISAGLGFFRSMGFGCAFVYGRFVLLGSSTPLDTE